MRTLTRPLQTQQNAPLSRSKTLVAQLAGTVDMPECFAATERVARHCAG